MTGTRIEVEYGHAVWGWTTTVDDEASLYIYRERGRPDRVSVRSFPAGFLNGEKATPLTVSVDTVPVITGTFDTESVVHNVAAGTVDIDLVRSPQ